MRRFYPKKDSINIDHHAFSLVELMVVIVIMGIMIGMFLPAFDSMRSSSKMSSSIKSVGAQINLTRQYAQANRQYAGLIIPGVISNFSPSVSWDLPEEYKYTIYRIALLTHDAATGQYMFDTWVQGTKWEFLPSGFSIMEADDDVGIQKDTGSIIEHVVKPPEENNTSQPSNQVLLVPLDAPLFHNTVSVLATCRAVIFAPSGKSRPVATHRYITIGEATWLGGEWLIKKPYVIVDENPVDGTDDFGIGNRSSSNQMTIVINGFTSGLSYISPEKYQLY
jgi:prepilin-type N-terminal cleavage/methylation domain-containing protein